MAVVEPTAEPIGESSIESEAIVTEVETPVLNAEDENENSALEPVTAVDTKPVQVEPPVAAVEEEIEQKTIVDVPVATVEKLNVGSVAGISLSAPTGSDRVDIIVNADTWADIKDGSGYQMIYDLLRANQKFSLIGEAPFALFFGNGHGVEVSLNDKTIDVMSHVQDDNTARLKIGGYFPVVTMWQNILHKRLSLWRSEKPVQPTTFFESGRNRYLCCAPKPSLTVLLRPRASHLN